MAFKELRTVGARFLFQAPDTPSPKSLNFSLGTFERVFQIVRSRKWNTMRPVSLHTTDSAAWSLLMLFILTP